MSFVFRGARPDLEGGLAGLMPDRRYVSGHGFHGTVRHVNTNSMAFLISVALLYMILSSEQMSLNLMIWVGMGVLFLASSLRMYSICHQLQAQAQAAAAAATAGGFLSHAELRLRMHPTLSFAIRTQLHGFRLQLALLDRELDDLDYDALRALDGVNSPGVPAMSDTDISRLPVRVYKRSSQIPAADQSQLSEGEELSSEEVKVDVVDETPDKIVQGEQKTLEELTCSVCLEQVVEGEIIRTLPCVHQFHAACIDLWLRQQATCPVCKFRLGGPETSMASSAATTTAFIV
ncbi:E3 ubiquitin-protein ligase SDIR1 isoform X2 [Physcomitrium patens]|uniref:RING-type E3 ubiquitin transferase n=1 Tax=Physcomitrium patens TaxID=3218 RepID=A0A7I4EJR5_PHYPA|nr:E3 ubiquitin-protein ligase SDIR1-like isoform X2 [Physcomitrium patens]|eukprot:XP_024384478.1 E3 ubiquitin-protein ligase SDIR1-like isoform X2 [Physcomitrella patens]